MSRYFTSSYSTARWNDFVNETCEVHTLFFQKICNKDTFFGDILIKNVSIQNPDFNTIVSLGVSEKTDLGIDVLKMIGDYDLGSKSYKILYK